MNFLAKYSACVLQISHMVSSGSLLSCFLQLDSNLFGENAFYGDRYFYIYFFTNFCVYSITPKLFKVFGWTFIGM